MASDAVVDSLVRELAGKGSSGKHTEACKKRLDDEARAASARAAARFATLSPVPTSVLDLASQDCAPLKAVSNNARKVHNKTQSRCALATDHL